MAHAPHDQPPQPPPAPLPARAPWARAGCVVLAIETSNPGASAGDAPTWLRPGVCLARLDESGAATLLTDEEPVHVEHQRDDLMGAIERVCARAGLAPRGVGAVAVSIGPGGFTSVRIAVTTAKCIAEATGAACVGVPTALVAAHAAGSASAGAPGPWAIALASKGETAYVACFGAGPRELAKPGIVDATALAALAHRHGLRTLLCDGHLPTSLRDGARAAGLTLAPIMLPPSACAHAARTQPALDPAQLVPLYPREPEAVTKWRALHGEGEPTPGS